MSPLIRIALVFLVTYHMLSPCVALRSSSNKGYSGKYDKGYKDPAKPKTLAGSSPGLPSQNATRRGLGMSAWGIVTLIVSLILAGMGFYYFSICYPILCRKERNYDMIGLPSVV